MKTLLVTGGCGFIGSHFLKRILKTKPSVKVINLDKLTYAGNRENTRALESLVQSLMAKADTVVHFAAETHVDRSIERPDDFLVTNILGTRNLLEHARMAKIKRFVHVSTDEVYGSVESGAAAEDAPLAPNSPYSASKAASDLMARAYWKTYGLPVIITRSSNNYGPSQYPEKVIPLFITNLLENKKVPLYGEGLQRRDWIYVEDNCAALELVLDHGKDGEIYNIGFGHDISNLELTSAILREMGAGENMINRVQDRPGHDFRYSLNVEKLRALGFRPSWSFEKGLKETVRWYREHTEWWQPLKRDKFTLKS
jgi:dTDP-glucose 4,6-dehydratase